MPFGTIIDLDLWTRRRYIYMTDGRYPIPIYNWIDPPPQNKHSIKKDELQGAPLMKVRVLDVYSDIFTGIGKFPGEPYKFQLKPNAKPARHAPRKVPIHL